MRGWLTDSGSLSDEIARLFIVEMEFYLCMVRGVKEIRNVTPLNWNILEVEFNDGIRVGKFIYTINEKTVSVRHCSNDYAGYSREWRTALPLSNTSLMLDFNRGFSNLSGLCETPDAKKLLEEYSARTL